MKFIRDVAFAVVDTGRYGAYRGFYAAIILSFSFSIRFYKATTFLHIALMLKSKVDFSPNGRGYSASYRPGRDTWIF